MLHPESPVAQSGVVNIQATFLWAAWAGITGRGVECVMDFKQKMAAHTGRLKTFCSSAGCLPFRPAQGGFKRLRPGRKVGSLRHPAKRIAVYFPGRDRDGVRRAHLVVVIDLEPR